MAGDHFHLVKRNSLHLFIQNEGYSINLCARGTSCVLAVLCQNPAEQEGLLHMYYNQELFWGFLYTHYTYSQQA